MLHVSMSRDSLPGYAMSNDPRSACKNRRRRGRRRRILYANMCLRIVCACVTATRIYQPAFITTTMTMTNSPRLAYQVAVAVARLLLPASCCLLPAAWHMICFCLAVQITQTRYAYLIDYICRMSLYFYYFCLAIFGLQLKLCLIVWQSQCSMRKQIFGFSCFGQTRCAKPASV